jgi:geranylgeranyl reductase family protein
MNACEVLIVGGGPAGSACAWALRNHGRDVIVMDKATFPRDKVCAGWITPAVLEELRIDPSEYADQRVFQPITGFLTGTIGGSTVRTDYDRVVSYGIRRCEFDHFLLQRSGARLQLGEAFRSARQERGAWIVNETIKSKWLIGAGGNFCPIARQFSEETSAHSEQIPVVLAQEVEFAMTEAQQAACDVAGTHPELYFCRDLKGYGWVFRKGNVINIGLGRDHETRLSEHVAEFCDFLHARGRIGFELPSRFHGHAYRLRTHVPQVSVPNVLLIGDAAGLASSHSGEGIRPAIESGLLAAAVLLENNAPETVAPEYAARLADRMGMEQTESTHWLPPAANTWLGQILLRTRWFTRHVVLDHWFLNIKQPALSV